MMRRKWEVETTPWRPTRRRSLSGPSRSTSILRRGAGGLERHRRAGEAPILVAQRLGQTAARDDGVQVAHEALALEEAVVVRHLLLRGGLDVVHRDGEPGALVGRADDDAEEVARAAAAPARHLPH